MDWLLAVPPLLGLGLVMGFSPTLYGYTLHELTRGDSPAVRWMTVGLLAASTLLVIVFQFFDPTNITRLLRHRIDELLLRRGVDVAAGVVFLIAGVAMLVVDRDDRSSPPHPTRTRPVGRTSPWRALLVGFGNTLVGFSGIATMYIVGRVASGVSAHLSLRALAYLVFALTLVAPYLLAAWAWTRYPGAAARLTRGYQRIAGRDFKRPVGVALLVAGAAFAALGLLLRP